jgi:hypothetical protein
MMEANDKSCRVDNATANSILKDRAEKKLETHEPVWLGAAHELQASRA